MPSLRCKQHLLPLLAHTQTKGSKRGLQPVPATRRDRRLKNIILIHHDKHKICPAANSLANVISFQAPEYINN